MVKDDIGGVWRTVGGRRIFIKDGEDLSTAMKNSGKFGNKKEKSKKGKEINDFEDKIRNNETETIGVFNEKGELIFEKTDDEKNIVNISTEEGKKLINGTLTHNHPTGVNFSGQDIDAAFKKGLKEIRAVHSNGEYSLKRTFEIGKEIPENYFNFAKDYNEAINDYARNTVDKIYERTGNPGRCNKMIDTFRDNWLKENAKKYGWEYEVKRNEKD